MKFNTPGITAVKVKTAQPAVPATPRLVAKKKQAGGTVGLKSTPGCKSCGGNMKQAGGTIPAKPKKNIKDSSFYQAATENKPAPLARKSKSDLKKDALKKREEALNKRRSGK